MFVSNFVENLSK